MPITKKITIVVPAKTTVQAKTTVHAKTIEPANTVVPAKTISSSPAKVSSTHIQSSKTAIQPQCLGNPKQTCNPSQCSWNSITKNSILKIII